MLWSVDAVVLACLCVRKLMKRVKCAIDIISEKIRMDVFIFTVILRFCNRRMIKLVTCETFL